MTNKYLTYREISETRQICLKMLSAAPDLPKGKCKLIKVLEDILTTGEPHRIMIGLILVSDRRRELNLLAKHLILSLDDNKLPDNVFYNLLKHRFTTAKHLMDCKWGSGTASEQIIYTLIHVYGLPPHMQTQVLGGAIVEIDGLQDMSGRGRWIKAVYAWLREVSQSGGFGD